MEKYWKDDGGDDASFWEHKWGKHGTCYSTLNPKCFTNYTAQEEVIDFFQQVVDQTQKLPTYEWLAEAGITPSASRSYTEAEIMKALRTPRGFNATLECDDGAQLYEVYYTFYVKGSVADGKFVPGQPVGQGNGCPATGIQYLPKNLTSTPVVNNTETSPASLASASAAGSSVEKTIGSTIAAITKTTATAGASPSGYQI